MATPQEVRLKDKPEKPSSPYLLEREWNSTARLSITPPTLTFLSYWQSICPPHNGGRPVRRRRCSGLTCTRRGLAVLFVWPSNRTIFSINYFRGVFAGMRLRPANQAGNGVKDPANAFAIGLRREIDRLALPYKTGTYDKTEVWVKH